MAGGYVQIDETPVEYLSPGNGQTKQGYLWACKRPGADVSFTWATSRAALCLERIVRWDRGSSSEELCEILFTPRHGGGIQAPQPKRS